ncbi:hypothetical protein [Corynebacterium alimapuense]|uniref:Serine hydrolase n=1 Tax=Corynebacterium alimapuense TaxID=1576874 RepID=A0A3M8K8B1_9CORY|nr:hypothetical protein [Corynebacterium alimapuense]RNE49463.1 hypothetical protein C5L39_03655 [Corynebacterium alimapuense]
MKKLAKQFIIGATSALLVAPMGVGVATAAPAPVTDGAGQIVAPVRTSISFEYSPTGFHVGTANEHESRPGLSIVKLYLADHIYRVSASQADKDAAAQMIRVSDDQIASELYARYPDSINETARYYGLNETYGAAHWGYSRTSTFDTVKYLEAKKRENPYGPVLEAMTQVAPVAADGYVQNGGTASLPQVIGTKFGWDDSTQSFTATASFGSDFSVSAMTSGNKEAMTEDVRNAFTDSLLAEGNPAQQAVWNSTQQFKGSVSGSSDAAINAEIDRISGLLINALG